jgi:hypothetical protein
MATAVAAAVASAREDDEAGAQCSSHLEDDPKRIRIKK